MGTLSNPIKPVIHRITNGPDFHWFAYYDKRQFDLSMRYALGMAVDFEHRSPAADDVIRVGLIDLQDGNRWIELGTSRAWCWQQGCMLQWRPGSASEVLWNDRQEDRFVCHILDVQTGHRRTLPHPVYAVSPDGRTAVGTDFRRIQHMYPGYGYAGLPDPFEEDLAPEGSGIYRLNLETGAAEMIINIAEVAAQPYPHADLDPAKHYFNHLLVSPDGRRFIFLHRWLFPGQNRQGEFGTRMLTANMDGSEMRAVDDFGYTSHFIWRDPGHILAWAYHPSHGERFYLYEDGASKVQVTGMNAMTRNGHCSYLPGGQWILNDSYPGEDGKQDLYLYHAPDDRKVMLGRFDSPPAYRGEWRCDLHPRSSPDGRLVTIDSVHEGLGRQIYLLPIEEYL
jgi:hypothetical protein